MRALAGLLLALALGPAAAGGRPVAQPPADAAIAQSNAALVRQAFAAWREGRGSLFDLLHEDVEWVVAGTSPVSGRYGSRQAFLEQAVAPIGARLATPIAPEVRQVLAQGDAVVVLWDGMAARRDGGIYRNSYAWHLVFDGGRIVRATAFLDTWALQRLMED